MKKFYFIAIVVLSIFSAKFCLAQPRIVASLRNWGPKSGGTMFRANLPGSTPGVVYSFDNTTPHNPYGGVVAGDVDWLYGVSIGGGANARGTFYRVRENGTLLTTLFHFNNSFSFHSVPYYHTDGLVYFVDFNEIRSYNTANGVLGTGGVNSIIESRNLAIDSDDWIYFLEYAFPSRLVKMKTNGSLWTQLHQFAASTEGNFGIAGVTEIPGDTLFGVMRDEGVNGGGTLFSINKDGTGFTIHHQFEVTTGFTPESKLIYFDGKLYGTTTLGGDFNKGVLYTINTDGSGYRVLHHFNLGDGTYTETPAGNIAISSDGKIFGAFRDWLYDNFNYSYLFKADTSGSNFTPFFNGNSFNLQRYNGQFNQDILLLEDDKIYFPTRDFGRNEGGVMNLVDTGGVGTDLFHYGNSLNGFYPTGLTKSVDNKLYGTNLYGGPEGAGVIFSIKDDGTAFTPLHRFLDAEGYDPSGRLLEASDGNLYGACRQGGSANSGSIYRIDKNGTGFQVIYDFAIYTGSYSPVGNLIEIPGGSLVGVNFWPYGGVFKINKDGTGYQDLKIFDGSAGTLKNPYSGVKYSRGYLYGTCGYGGAGNYGGVFRMKTDGSGYEVLHEFNSATEGELPVSSPVIASNGKLYGTTAFGGSTGNGTIYRLDSTGANFSILRDLSSSDGGNSFMDMIQASDGALYAGSQTGGTNGGTLFRINMDGTGFTVVTSFDYEADGTGVSSLIDLNINVALPVKLISLQAQKQNQSVLLTWKTAQEQNSNRFEIERSSDGRSYSVIGTVAAAGNTNSFRNYSFTDNGPLSGMNYYRLREVDIDESYSHSRIVAVNFGATKEWTIYPNPAADRLMIRLPNGSNYTAIRVRDAAGKLIQQQSIASSGTIEVDVHRLSKGLYIVELVGDNKAEKIFLKE